jgi:hypothetical protein
MFTMDFILMIAAAVLTVFYLVYTIIFRYTTLRSVKVVTTLVCVILSLPLLGVSLYVLFTKTFGSEANLWAVGICGLLLGFWLKSPFSDISD